MGYAQIRNVLSQKGYLEGPIVASIELAENESIAACEDPFIRNEIPFILAIDKVSK